MIIGSPDHGIQIPGVAGVAPIDPLTVADRLRVMYYNEDAPYGPQKSLVLSGDPASPGDDVWMVADQILIALLPGPSEPRDQANNGGQQPTMTLHGLQFDTGGVQTLDIANTPVQSGLSVFTAYLFGSYVAGSTWVALGNNAGVAALGFQGDGLLAVTDGVQFLDAVSDVAAGKVLLRLDSDGTTVNIAYTGNSTGYPVTLNTPGDTFTFNQVGQSLLAGNSDTGNLHLGHVIVGRKIVKDSPEDLGIRAFISTTYPGYAL